MSDRFDEAAAGAFLVNELRHVLPRVHKVQYSEITYAQHAEVTNEVPEGAEEYTYDVFDYVGESREITDYADDLPTSDVRRGEIRLNIRPYGTSFKYTVDELRKMEYARRSLTTDRADACRMSYEQTCNKLCYFGKAGSRLSGLLNHPTVDVLTVTGSASDGWFDAASITTTQMRAILDQGIDYAMQKSKLLEQPDTVIFPYSVWRKLSTTQNESGTDTTVLDFWLRSNPFIKNVSYLNELNPANSSGNLSAERIVFYKKNDPIKKPKFHVPMPLKFHAPQQRNFVFMVPAEYKIGGIELPYPTSMTYMDKG